ncbi:error-prone DNA polymerase [Pseudoroseomonas globiformis]|uniref:Error-prone DNA polymerase n=1 Tax=Teichococcus globiformis TaxID=2307229 RepID=A0ABV7G165_9PROT
MIRFAELAARSNFSLLDGASHPEEMVRTAHALGQAGLGLCDENSLAGVVRAHGEARKLGFPFAPGARLVLKDGSQYLAWPVSLAGYGRLTRLLSEARAGLNQEDASGRLRGECRITHRALLAAAGEWCLAALPPERPDDAFAARMARDAAALRSVLSLPLLCAAVPLLDGHDDWRIGVLSAMAAQAGATLLASTHPRFHHADRRRLADVLSAIRLSTTVDRLGFAAERNGERALKSPEWLARIFARHPDALAASLRVLEATRGFSLDQLRYEYPHEILEEGRTPQQSLAARVEAALVSRWGCVSDGLRARLDEELQLIERLGYAPYFLTVHEIVRFAQEKGILCQGRGSAANSAVCYVLGITAIDPDEHDLLFARFVSESRNEPPDIDIDFEHERREEVIQHLYQRYGRDRAAICATVIRYRARSAVREVGKVLGLSEDVTGRLAKGAWGPGRDRTLSEIAAADGLDPADRRLALALELAEEIQDFPRHLATHVGGFVITQRPLVELAVVRDAAMKDRTVLEWDKDDIDALGMLKVDVLGLGMLSCLQRGLVLLERHKRITLTLPTVPADCAETFAMLQRADSVGVFQVESRAQMNMLPRLRPSKFYDLVVEVAIVRPGPIQGNMVHPYLKRKSGLEKPDFRGPMEALRPVLEKTLGVPLFQEQAMRIAIVAAGFTPAEADALRRDMATFKAHGKVSRFQDRMVEGMVERGFPRDFAENCFRQIEGFGSYGFPESHAASFAKLVYISAWIKCHHPDVFVAALLNSQPMGFYAPAQLVRDAQNHDVPVRAADVNASAWDCTLEAAPGHRYLALRLGLRMVAGLSEKDGQGVVAARLAGNGAPFASVEELVRRAGIGRHAVEALAAADALGGMGLGRRSALWEASTLPSGTAQDLPLFAAAEAARLLSEPSVSLPPEAEGEAVANDYARTGLTLRRHPMALLRPALSRLGLQDTRDVRNARPGALLRLPGIVLMRQRPGTAKGVVFLTIEDEFGEANIVVYSAIGARDRAALVGARLLIAEGRIKREADPRMTQVPITHLIARRLTDRSDLLAGMAQGDVDAIARRSLGPADEVRRPGPVPLVSLPPSRDFR